MGSTKEGDIEQKMIENEKLCQHAVGNDKEFDGKLGEMIL